MSTAVRRDNTIHVGIGIPLSWPYVHSHVYDNAFQLEFPCKCTVLRIERGNDIAAMRTALVYKAKRRGCTHLLHLDADMLYPHDTIARLLAHDKDIVSALCFRRRPPFDPILRVGKPYKTEILYPYPEGLVEVTATGGACIMVKMSVYDAFEKAGEPFYTFNLVGPEGQRTGEDIGFCYIAKKLGFKVYVDTTIKTDHLAIMPINENFWKFYYAATKAAGKKLPIRGGVENGDL